jgi:fido (protein-threonine AMPylation protein)
MNGAIDLRVESILRLLSDDFLHTRQEVELTIHESPRTANRLLNELIAKGWVVNQGNARSVTYKLTPRGHIEVIFDLMAYLKQPPVERAEFTSIQPTLFGLIEGSIPEEILKQFGIARDTYAATRTSIDSATTRKELQRFVVEFSWKSSAIEGNTYTIHDTELLLTEGKPAPRHSTAEATMIVNHKKAFNYIWNNAGDYKHLTRSKLLDIHQLMVADLDVPTGLRIHPVGITGTIYTPPAGATQLASYLDDILDRINSLKEPVEKAMACLTLLPYLQPFLDGNKRTSRMVANAMLLAYNYPPISFFTVKEEEYKGALLLFYERGVLGNFRELVLEQLQYSSTHYFFKEQ